MSAFEAEEFEYGKIDRCVESYASLVRANGFVELYAVAEVGLDLAFVVDPCHSERDDAVGFDHAFYDARFLKFGMFVIDILHAHQHFFDGLEILFFSRVFYLKGTHDIVYIHIRLRC